MAGALLVIGAVVALQTEGPREAVAPPETAVESATKP
jgi:hypothetical protein